MLDKRFWVIGGTYTSLSFDRLIDGTEHLFGPFPTHGEAERAWRDVSEQHRSECTTRFAIVHENWRTAAV
jgi:hypothetical protein